MDYNEIKDPDLMHAAVSRDRRAKVHAGYYEEYAIDAAVMINEHVPRLNRLILQTNPWLKKIVATFAMTDIPGRDLIDPLYIVARDGLTELSFYWLDDPRPAVPTSAFCESCREWEAVRPVRLPYNARIIELLLCADCVEVLEVVAS
ncbi:MAG TPA: hypothetical protein VHZ81_06740 [Galbitalea sp.]|jgi:hypothetical protein|nr:hypothetical protein [Galbitalea sp.]